MRTALRPSLRVAPCLALAGAAGSAWLAISCAPPEPQDPVARLAGAAGDVRVVRARLTGGFGHDACLPEDTADRLVSGLLCRHPPPATWPGAQALERLAIELRGPPAADSVSRRHAIGLWHLLWGEPRNAVDELQAASRLDPTKATVQSDLAAALLALAESTDDPRPMVDALMAADSAVALDATLAEARFNRALAVEWLHLTRDALRAWSAYLELDAATPWAREAQGRIERLARAPATWEADSAKLPRAVTAGDTATVQGIVDRFPAVVRREARRALEGWAQAWRAGSRGVADSALQVARVLAYPLARATGNTLPVDAVEVIDRARSRGDHSRLDDLARGQIALVAAVERLDGSEPDARRALQLARQARVRLERARSPLAAWTAYSEARIWYHRADYDQALAVLRALRAATPRRHAVVRSTAAQLAGLIHQIRGHYEVALAAYDTAVTEARGTGEPTLLLRPRSRLAEVRSALHGEVAAWRELYAALVLSSHFPDAYQARYTVFSDAAQQAWLVAPKLAVRFQDEVVNAAESLAEPIYRTGALLRRAELSLRLGEHAAARDDLEAARGVAAEIPDSTRRAQEEADLDLVAGQVMLNERPQRALAALQRATRAYRNTDYGFALARAYLLLAQAFVATGARDSGEVALEAAVKEIERQRDLVEAYQARAQFLDRARPVFDDIVLSYAERGEAGRAFDYIERMRARMLFERVTVRAPDRVDDRGWSTDDLRRQIPAGVNLVCYAVLDRELLIWLTRPTELRLIRVPVAAAEVAVTVERFEQAATGSGSRDELDAVAEKLYRLLIEPVADLLEPAASLVFVPDKWLHFVPFAALRNPRTGTFLVEEHAIGLAPSAALFVDAVARSRAHAPAKEPRLLAIGNPRIDRRAFALPDLPGAEREARAAAAAFGDTAVLLGAGATRSALAARAPDADVIHFAGHGVVRTDAPLESYLVLAPEADRSGALYARDLFGWHLERTRLAVLSGCHTAGGSLSPTEGASSLARAFFAAGVPAVVASLWAVDDDETADFFTAYYRRLAAGKGPAIALRETQMEWIGGGGRRARRVATWAAFQVFGWGG